MKFGNQRGLSRRLTRRPVASSQTFLGPALSAPLADRLKFSWCRGGTCADLSLRAILRIPTAGSARNSMCSGTIPVSPFSIKRRATLLFGPVAGNTLFQSLGGDCATHNDGDPVVSFDILAGRWVLSQFVVGGSPDFSHQCVAVSQTEDATGEYFLYDFVTDSQNFVDYPKTGVWPDGYYMSGRIFNASGTAFLARKNLCF